MAGADPQARFEQGYLDYNGDPALLGHVWRVVTECEGSRWEGYYGPYWTRAQFSSDTWAKVQAGTGLTDPDDPYTAGAGVAWWIAQIGVEAAGTTSGWPVCWWRVQ